MLPVEGRSFAEYWAARPGKMRTTLKRKARKVEVKIRASGERHELSLEDAVNRLVEGAFK